MLVPVLLGVSIIIFFIMRVVPGDPALLRLAASGQSEVNETQLANLRREMGTDRPYLQQYGSWVKGLVTLNVGNSLVTGRPVLNDMGRRLLVTGEFAILTILVSLVIAIPAGVLSAARQDSWVDHIFRVVSVAGLSMPGFWTATLLILFLVRMFHWAPPLTYVVPWNDPLTNLKQMIWPCLVTGYFMAALVARMTRSQMLEVLRQDYVRTAWAKGLPQRLVFARHAMKNALLPVVTITGGQLGHLLGAGSVLMETIFALPGTGRLLVTSILTRDYPVVQTIVVLIAAIFVVMNLLVDLLYAWLDPRIRYG